MPDMFEEIPAVTGGKRLGVQWCTWMGDWFTSWSPRNSNSNAEGPWDHWVDLALAILHDSMTAKVRPEAHAAVAGLIRGNFYDETNVALTDADLAARFERAPASPTEGNGPR
jgi:hypothetical protein